MTKTKSSDGAPKGFFNSVLVSRLHGIRASDADDFDNACEKHNVTVTFHRKGEGPKRWPDEMTDEELRSLCIHLSNLAYVNPVREHLRTAMTAFTAKWNTPKPEEPRPGARVFVGYDLTERVKDMATDEYLHPAGWQPKDQGPAWYPEGTGQAALDAWRKEEVERGAAD